MPGSDKLKDRNVLRSCLDERGVRRSIPHALHDLLLTLIRIGRAYPIRLKPLASLALDLSPLNGVFLSRVVFGLGG